MKYNVDINETRTFRHRLIVETDSKEELDEMLDEIEGDAFFSFSEIEQYVNDKNIKIIEETSDFDGYTDEVECDYSET